MAMQAVSPTATAIVPLTEPRRESRCFNVPPFWALPIPQRTWTNRPENYIGKVDPSSLVRHEKRLGAVWEHARVPDERPKSEDHQRPDLVEVLERGALTRDEARDEAIERRHAAGARTARENIADLVDPGSLVEYGRFAIAAQRGRREVEDLIAKTPADGLVAGTARINGELFGERSACAVLSYDYTVLAGTQGALGHRKKDRLFELIERMRLPTVFFAEGGGGRPGDTDYPVVSALDTRAFALWARLSGLVPRIAIVAGRCFAGNAVIAGCSDLIVATENISLGMGGPAMIEGGGLGKVDPDEVGPIAMQAGNGVVDLVVADEAAAVEATKRLLGYFQGSTPPGTAPDQAALREAVPERQRRAYAVQPIVETLADAGSTTFLRERFAPEMVTALIRIEGRPLGVIANDTRHVAGAITSDAADKAARFLQLCDSFGLPVLSLIDTPGMMVGPAAEATGLVRHASRLLIAGAALNVPLLAVILRRGYGLGAQAMAGGSLHEPLLTVAWPSAHLGPMGLEGAVRLALRKELDAIADEDEREQRVRDLTAAAEENAKALNAAALFEIDDVIDPAETRSLIASTLAAAAPGYPAGGSGRTIDAW
jgi:acetyl-CoA carboxylase carboxyltransferase component